MILLVVHIGRLAFHTSCNVCCNLCIFFSSIRQELFGFIALKQSTTSEWCWNGCYFLHWWSVVLWWSKCCWWYLVILNPTQDPVSTLL